MHSSPRIAIALSFSAALLLSCGDKKEVAEATNKSAETTPTPPAEPKVDPQPTPVVIDAAPPAPVLHEGQFALDLDGDGKDEIVTITPALVELGDEIVEHGMAGKISEGTQPTGHVVDVDSTDNRKELIVRLTSYESLAYNVVVYMREGKLMLSKIIYTSKLEGLGDGRLHSENWIQGKRTDAYYHFEGNELVTTKPAKQKRKKSN